MRQRANLKNSDVTINPFDVQRNLAELKSNLDEIDSKSIRFKFKNSIDPINLAFNSIESTSVQCLAKDFVRETISDFISFVSKICK